MAPGTPILAALAGLCALALMPPGAEAAQTGMPATGSPGVFSAPSGAGGAATHSGGKTVGAQGHGTSHGPSHGKGTATSGQGSGGQGQATIGPAKPTTDIFHESHRDHGHGFEHAFDHDHDRDRHFRHHRPFPVILVPGTVATYAAVHEDDGEGDDVFSIVNDSDEEMTVYDNGTAMCTLAPGARCSFDTSKGQHEISVRMGRAAASAQGQSGHGGKMIILEKDAAP
jgi:hypothetical protein